VLVRVLVIVIGGVSSKTRPFEYDYEHRFAEHEHENLCATARLSTIVV